MCEAVAAWEGCAHRGGVSLEAASHTLPPPLRAVAASMQHAMVSYDAGGQVFDLGKAKEAFLAACPAHPGPNPGPPPARL